MGAEVLPDMRAVTAAPYEELLLGAFFKKNLISRNGHFTCSLSADSFFSLRRGCKKLLLRNYEALGCIMYICNI